MKVIQFKVKLLSDIILNQKSASQGNQETLDFIPGSNFLGIVASNYTEFTESEQLTVFHSSKVRFGDAHPILENKRALRTPASFQKPKIKDETCYVHHSIPDFKVVKDLQLKQSRSDFQMFTSNTAIQISPLKSFSIKSAYDREKRRSQDEKMYGYQSIQQDAEYCFEICFDEDVNTEIIESIKTKLIGKKRIGRSRTAQYGLIEIQEEAFEKSTSDFGKKDEFVIYAESRLIFLDNYLNPTLTPKPENFGVKGGEILWGKSQVRTFAYSPYNYHRACFDAERKGIEKGSVFVIKGGELTKNIEFAGEYLNEGFGKIIINPDFFACNEMGVSTLEFKDSNKTKKEKENLHFINAKLNDGDDKLWKFLLKAKNQKEAEKEIYKLVNEFVKDHQNKFKSDSFASQWGSIRSLAMQYPEKADLERELFTKTITRNKKEVPNAYLTHGVAKEKWSERGRFKVFKDFFNDEAINEEMIQFAIINLSAEMAKIYGRKKA